MKAMLDDEVNMPLYQSGYYLMGYASYVLYLDLVFVIYALVTVVVRALRI